MITILRPYADHIETAMCLCKQDRFNMKLKSHLMINVICELMGWKEKTIISKNRKRDPFVKYYFNKGKPRLDALIDYHYTMYFYWMKACGTECELSDDFELIYEQHKKECSDTDPWKNGNALMHKMYLLKWDYEWYKRHFRKHYIYKLDSYKMFEDKKLRKVYKKDLIKFRELIDLDSES